MAGAFDGWASAALGGGIGGIATGLALFFTIRHDRAARQEDRRQEAADVLVGTLADLVTAVATDQPGDVLATMKARGVHRSAVFEARLSRRDSELKARLIPLGDAVSEAIPSDLGKDDVLSKDDADRAIAAMLVYLELLNLWLAQPSQLRHGFDFAEVSVRAEATARGRVPHIRVAERGLGG